MKPIKTIVDPEAFQLLADETRRKIVFLLRVKELTVSQIAAELNLTPQAVYHHVKKLVKGGMIEVVREERVGHLIESYYRATAESFNFSMGQTHLTTSRGREMAKEQETAALGALKKLGFNIEYGEEQVFQMVSLRGKMDECCKSGKHEDAISELDELDFPTKLLVEEYAEILSMSDEEFRKQQEISRKLRELLKSLVRKRSA